MPDLLERLKSALADRYAIESEIGRGGMAVVFLAEDLKHRRQVAIKVLHPELTATLGAERFLHEIEIVAGLQHPHIQPLYDSGDADGLLYYVMPYARGESLRHRLDREQQLAVDESVRIAVEVADGLDYAHRQGVVHRDIKPGNILLAEGHATIADFGIARAVEVARAERVTSTGLGVGTPLYASPEQTAAQETLDGRTDIYSLGCVLYEMLAGEPPLTGSTPEMIQARRLSETPTALHSVRDTIPLALDQAISRALARVPADRYATASQFGQALQAAVLVMTPVSTPDLHSASSIPTLATTPPKMRRLKRLGGVAAVATVLAGAMVLLYPRLAADELREIATSNIARITNEIGWEFWPAISPDGREVAFFRWRLDGPPTEIRSTVQLGLGGELRPFEPQPGFLYWYPSWTPDGSSLRVLACKVGVECTWNQVARLGGAVVPVSHQPPSPAAWSPDGTRIAYAIADSIFVADSLLANPELVGIHTANPDAPHSLAWSPDGQRIAYVNGNDDYVKGDNAGSSSIWVLPSEGGDPLRVTDDEYTDQSPQWLPDNRHLLFVSDRDGVRAVYVTRVEREPAGWPSRQLAGPQAPHTISVSRDGQKLVYSEFRPVRRIRMLPVGGSNVSVLDAPAITRGDLRIQEHDLSLDGQWIAFDADVGGEFAIYKQRLDGGELFRVATLPGGAFEPAWSADGGYIAFSSTSWLGAREGQIYTVPSRGGAPEQVTFLTGSDHSPDWAPDGLSIAYTSRGAPGDSPTIWTISRGGLNQPFRADPVQLSDTHCSLPDWAPDGSGLVCIGGGVLKFLSPEGMILWSYVPPEDQFAYVMLPRFSPDGSRVYFWAGEADLTPGIWWIPVGGGAATKAVDYDRDLGGYGISIGSDAIYMTVGEKEGDIWVMDLDW